MFTLLMHTKRVIDKTTTDQGSGFITTYTHTITAKSSFDPLANLKYDQCNA